MCTALSIKSNSGNCFFGRNMDLEYNFNQSVMIIPRNFQYKDKITGNIVTNNYSIIGMGTIIDNHVVIADGMNEYGLACAGLNFQGYAYFEKSLVKNKINITPYDFIQWILSNYKTVDEVKKIITDIELVNIPINEKTPVPTLHWMIADKTGKSIVVEKTKKGISVYDNPVGVLTNNPTFDWHLTNLNEYLHVNPTQPKNANWSLLQLKPLGVGAGTLGIPGDFASVSRFVRIAYLRANMPTINNDTESITQFFNMLDYVKMVKGAVITKDCSEDLTIYSSCMNQTEGVYYYRTYYNNRINAINLHKENLNGSDIKLFPYNIDQDINYQN